MREAEVRVDLFEKIDADAGDRKFSRQDGERAGLLYLKESLPLNCGRRI